MTRLCWWEDERRDHRVIMVNDCLITTVSYNEARDTYDFREYAGLVTQRVAPLVWLAMPDHEESSSL